MTRGKRFTDEFELEPIKLATKHQVSVREVYKRLGVSAWIFLQRTAP